MTILSVARGIHVWVGYWKVAWPSEYNIHMISSLGVSYKLGDKNTVFRRRWNITTTSCVLNSFLFFWMYNNFHSDWQALPIPDMDDILGIIFPGVVGTGLVLVFQKTREHQEVLGRLHDQPGIPGSVFGRADGVDGSNVYPLCQQKYYKWYIILLVYFFVRCLLALAFKQLPVIFNVYNTTYTFD